MNKSRIFYYSVDYTMIFYRYSIKINTLHTIVFLHFFEQSAITFSKKVKLITSHLTNLLKPTNKTIKNLPLSPK